MDKSDQSVSSYVGSLRCIVAGMRTVERRDGSLRASWCSRNDAQERFVREYVRLTSDQDVYLNHVFRHRILPREDAFHIVARTGIHIRPIAKSGRVPIIVDRRRYRGASMSVTEDMHGKRDVTFRRSRVHSEWIVTLRTEGEDIVHLTKFAERHDPLDLLFRADEIIRESEAKNDFPGVSFPEIDLRFQLIHDWVTGLKYEKRCGGFISLDHARESGRLRISGGTVLDQEMPSHHENLVIDGSFLCVFERPTFRRSLIAAVLCPDAWKEENETSK